jgi:RHS repeat-associated protein
MKFMARILSNITFFTFAVAHLSLGCRTKNNMSRVLRKANFLRTNASALGLAVGWEMRRMMACGIVLMSLCFIASSSAHAQATSIFYGLTPRHSVEGWLGKGGIMGGVMSSENTNSSIARVELREGNQLINDKWFTVNRDADGNVINDYRSFAFGESLANGTHQLYVRAVHSGNAIWTDSPVFSVTVYGQVISVTMQDPNSQGGGAVAAPDTLKGTMLVKGYADGNGSTIKKMEVLDGSTVRATVPLNISRNEYARIEVLVDLSVGTHQLTIRATDELNQTGTSPVATVTIVPPPPLANLTSPPTGAIYRLDEGRSYATVNILGNGSAFSPATLDKIELLDNDAVISWKLGSSINENRQLEPGEHWLQFRVTDSLGRKTSTPFSRISVGGSSPTDTTGTATMTAPRNDTFTTSGTSYPVQVTGQASPSYFATTSKIEVMDGSTVIASMNGDAINTSVNLGVGSHTLSLRSTDSLGHFGVSSAAIITIAAGPPSGTLSSPTSTIFYAAAGNTQPINFIGTGSAAGGYAVTKLEVMEGTNVLATQNGSSINKTVTLPAGSHVVRLRATDSSGKVGFGPSVGFTIEAAPVPPAPTLSVTRTPSTVNHGLPYSVNWSTSNATSVSYNCTAGGTGMTGSAAGLAPSGSLSGVAQSGWIGYPTTCVWTANGSGGTTTSSEVMTTVASGNNAQITAQAIPAEMISGVGYDVNVTVKNTGTTSWTSLGDLPYLLVPVQDPSLWGTPQVYLPRPMNPGDEVQVYFRVTAPLPGTYNLQWQMSKQGFGNFGGISSRTVVVKADVPTAGLTAPQANARFAATGTTYPVRFSGSGYPNGTNSISKTELLENGQPFYSVNAGGVDLTVPVSIGNHSVQMRVTDSKGTVGLSQVVSFAVDPPPVPAPTINVVRSPSTLMAGQAYSVSWTTTNATTVAYSCVASGSGMTGSGTGLGPNDTLNSAAQASWIGFPSSCSWTAQGPSGNATYTETVTTVDGGNRAQVIGTTIPAQMNAGASYPVSVTMRNTGSSTWSVGGATSYVLANTSSGGQLLWGTQKAYLVQPIGPSGQWTFNFTVTAPSPGIYDQQWQMLQEGMGSFGDVVSKMVEVVPAPGRAPTLALEMPTAQATYETAGMKAPVRIKGTVTSYDGATGGHIDVFEGSTLIASENGDAIDKTVDVTGQGIHHLVFRAYDTLGRVSADTMRDITVSYKPPVPTLTSPVDYKNEYWKDDSTPNVRLAGSAVASGDRTIVKLELLNGGNLYRTFTGGSFDVVVNMPKGYYFLTLRATDSAGQTGITPIVTFGVFDAPLPTLTVKRSPRIAYVGQQVSVQWDASVATAVTYSCTGAMTESGSVTPVATGTKTWTAVAGWLGLTTCKWTASGLAGQVEWTETMQVTQFEVPKAAAVFELPVNGSQVSVGSGGANVYVKAKATIGNGLSITKVNLYNNGILHQSYASDGVDQLIHLDVGTHTLRFEAVDELGRTGNSATTIVEVTAVPKPVFVKATRTPTPMKAGADYTVNWEVDNANYLQYSCVPLDGQGMSETVIAPIAAMGSFTHRAQHTWVDHPSKCTWTARGFGGETVFIEELVSTERSLLPDPPTVVWQNIAAINFKTHYVSGTAAFLELELQATPGAGAAIKEIGLYNNEALVRVLPSGTTKFAFDVVAGTNYALKLRAIDNFDQSSYDYSSTLIFTVQSAANEAQFVEQQPPGPLVNNVPTIVAGLPFTAKLKVRNAGSTTWSDSTGYELVSVGNGSPEWVVGNKVNLPGQVVSGAYQEFTINGRAPDSAGDYQYQWQMSQRGSESGHGPFEAKSQNLVVRVTPGSPVPSVFSLAASPRNAWVATGQTASINLTGSATVGTGRIVNLQLFDRVSQQDGNEVLLKSVGKVATTDAMLLIAHTAALSAGEHALFLRATNSAGYITNSEPVFVSVTDTGNMLGIVKGVRTGMDSTPRLVGWACEDSKSAPLAYKVYRNAWPSQGGVLIASGSASLSSELDSAEVSSKCHTPDAAHGFSVDLITANDQSPTGIPAGTNLFVTVLVNGIEKNLPCEDGNCVMPDGLRVGLALPEDGDQHMGPASIFMQAKVANGTIAGDQIAFNFEGEWLSSSPDATANTYFARKEAVAARSAPYIVYARVLRDGKALYTVENRVYVRESSSLTLKLSGPAPLVAVSIGQPVPLKVEMVGLSTAVNKIRFYDGRILLGEGDGSGQTRTLSWTPTMSKSYAIRARAFDASNVLLAESGQLTIVVGAGGSSDSPIPIMVDIPQLNSTDAGTLPGGISVSDGTAAYSIPIALPPGTNGMVPSLSLGYRSDNTTGSAGLGWSLNGLSNIDRCGRTIATDGIADAVRFEPDALTAASLSLTEAGDRLCLDGQRLILVNGSQQDRNKSAAYWATDAEYRTEIESFSRIRTVMKNGKRTFIVETKDGYTSTFGDTADSYVEAIGRGDGPVKLAHRWRISRREDRSKNYISYSYLTDANDGLPHSAPTGENKPWRIEWGGNSSAATGHYASVEFGYDARDDARTAYISGVPVHEFKRLASITTRTALNADGSNIGIVNAYSLGYEPENSPSSGRSLLKSVKVCDANGACLPPSTFAYGRPDPAATTGFVRLGGVRNGPNLDARVGAVDLSTAWTSGNTPRGSIITGDFNGDGKTDILERYRTAANGFQQTLYESNASGTDWTISKPLVNLGSTTVVVEAGDFDGDGRLDLLVADQALDSAARTNWRTCLGKHRSAGNFVCEQSRPFPASAFTVARPDIIAIKDFNGDGRDDVYINGGAVRSNGVLEGVEKYRCMSTGDSFDCQSVVGTYLEYQPGRNNVGGTLASSAFADFDGDGRVDEVGLGRCVRRQRPGSNTFEWFCGEYSVGGLHGLLLSAQPEANATRLYGSMFTLPNSQSGTLAPMTTGTLTADLNADGYSDVVFDSATAQIGGTFSDYQNNICFSKGHGWGDCRVLPPYVENGKMLKHVVSVGDFDGDGIYDVLRPVNDIWMEERVTEYRLCNIGPDASNTAQGMFQRCKPWSGPTFYGLAGVSADSEYSPIDAFNRTLSMFIGDFDGDGKQDIATYLTGGQWEIWGSASQAKAREALDKLVSVTNGIGHTEYVDYALSNDNTVYSTEVPPPTNTALSTVSGKRSYPGRYLVRAVRRENGVGDMVETRYSYAGYAVDPDGRGSLGFALTTTTNMQTMAVERTWHSQTFPNVGAVIYAQTVAGNGVMLSDMTATYGERSPFIPQDNGAATRLPYLATSKTVRLDLDGSPLGITDLSSAMPNKWGNVAWTLTNSRAAANDTPMSVRRDFTFYPENESTWRIADLDTVKETRTTPTSSLDRTVKFTYEAVSGLVETESRFAGDGTAMPLVSYGRTDNKFGLVNTTTLGTGANARQSSVSYDDIGRFAKSRTNPLGQKEELLFDPRSGAPSRVIDANGLTTTQTSNAFGRVLSTVAVDGARTTTYLKSCASNCPPGAALVVVTDTKLGEDRIVVPTITFSDNAGHVLRKLTWGTQSELPDRTIGSMIARDFAYDGRGRLSESYQPRFVSVSDSTGSISSATSILERHIDYDELNRVTSSYSLDEHVAPATNTSTYKGFTVTSRNPLGRTKSETKDAWGRVVTMVDSADKTTGYAYDAFNNLRVVTDPALNEVKITYNGMGQRTELQDPDLGTVTYKVDLFGQVYEQITAEDDLARRSTKMGYDKLGRMISRTSYDMTAEWVYDTANLLDQTEASRAVACAVTKSCGKLIESNTKAGLNGDFVRTHSYDAKGRPSVTTTMLDKLYTSVTEYDEFGRHIREKHSRGQGTAKQFDWRYDRFGTMVRIERGQLVLWRAHETDAASRVTDARLGNGLLVHRDFNRYTGYLFNGSVKDGVGDEVLGEGYSYDGVGNVASRTQSWAAGEYFNEIFTYDAMNRLDSSTIDNVTQIFTYDDIGNIKSKTGLGIYGYLPSRPHAVQNIAGLGAFGYDLNGNLLSGAGRTATWNSFDMPVQIAKGSERSTFVYGPDHQRTVQTRYHGGTSTSIYSAGSMEVETEGGNTTVKTYWPMGLGVEIERSNAAAQLRWTHLDRIGSVVAISNELGVVRDEDRMAYDSWGKRRALKTNSVPDSIDGVTDNKGFTGHEMLDQLDLVHMNGRVYDPLVARFMSADPIIQDPMHSQSYNRYTYVWNNPTNLTDPTGFMAADGTPDGRDIQIANDLAHNAESFDPTGWQVGSSQGGAESPPQATGSKENKNTNVASTNKNGKVEVTPKCSPAPCAYHYGYDKKLKANITAIVREDGTVELRAGNIPWRDNNPGDIRDYGSFGRNNGAIGTDTVNPSDKHGFLVFPNKASGEAAMGKLLDSYGEKGLDLAGAISKWAPPTENDTAAYQADVAKAVGVSQDAKLKDFTPEQKQKLMQAIMMKEGYFNTGRVTEGQVTGK